ncbi:hypothetical protein [Spirosoma jeollabukense]
MNKFYLLLFLVPLWSQAQDSLTTRPTQNVPTSAADTISQQRSVPKTYLRKDVWRIDFLGPGFLNEHRLGKQTTLVSQFRLVGSFRSEDKYERNGYSYTVKKALAFSINPELSVALRRFYNLAKRKETGKSIRYNSGSYFALKTNFVGPALFNNSSIDIQGLGASAFWGVQHTAPKHFYVNLELGIGVAQYYENTVSPTGNFMLGYTF